MILMLQKIYCGFKYLSVFKNSDEMKDFGMFYFSFQFLINDSDT